MKIKLSLKNFGRDEKGSILVFTAFGVIILMGMASFAMDFGVASIRANEVQNAADAAALAGSEKLPLKNDGDWDTVVVPVATDYAVKNGISGAVVTPVKNATGKIVGVKVEGKKTVENTFIRALGSGHDTIDVTRSAVARIFTVTEVSKGANLKPIGINKEIFKPGFNGDIALDIDPSDDNAVKYGYVHFDGGNDANKLKNWMEKGYDGNNPVKIDNVYDWTNGSKASVVQAYNDLVGQEILVPIYEVIDFDDKKGEGDIKIVGFAVIKVEDFKPGKDNKNMKATFVRYANISGTPSDDDNIVEYRAYAGKLVE